MRNFNTQYNLAKVYNNFKEFKLEDKKNPTVAHVNNIDIVILEINLVYIIIDNNFDSFSLSCIASKQIYIIICNKSMTKVKDKFDKIYIDI